MDNPINYWYQKYLKEKQKNEGVGRPVISDKELLDRAIDFIVWREEENDYICEELHKIPEEFKLCAEDCQNLDHWCVLRFLMHYKPKEDESER